jgi:antitoxin VapB
MHIMYICGISIFYGSDVMGQTAKVFMSGGSQAVRLPASFRFQTDEVAIRRDPVSGDVILSPRPAGWSTFLAAVEQARMSQPSEVDDAFLADRDMRAPERGGIL